MEKTLNRILDRLGEPGVAVEGGVLRRQSMLGAPTELPQGQNIAHATRPRSESAGFEGRGSAAHFREAKTLRYNRDSKASAFSLSQQARPGRAAIPQVWRTVPR